jgi:hypothetical protein
MKYFAHRINASHDLETIDNDYGIELDLRDYTNDIIVQHDPYKTGESFKDYIKYVHNRDMILNVKCERIEQDILDILHSNNYIGSYFFLDCSFPMIFALSQKGEQNIALRFSEYEGLDILRSMKGRVKWVWVDVFTKLPLTYEICKEIKEMGYNICLVSPELQGHEEDIELYANQIRNDKLHIDAICTKSYNIKRWQIILNE